ncbi:type II toxin-antitoxin system CcdA family antitoxin [Methylophaga nitratireducenticrescens]|jgi:antitoxin CcdA|uniref:Acetoacetyl-CoA synthase n=1 Tax=Methylophaga nitratireducenticrescens TaxID=754476 RepID=I1XLK6_METNJ|nr:type II toxin-antitoxin system CcdA family antitoxin [Methylophaga nitratireducenticrescens]AFI85275.1 acetoacetyl-CoA synthase [Methylophaga nitratireducenticrescens]AUZ85760.1 acetoacetyl-CoA synthase [Methylophaga nitratireducenticrescens]
MQSLFDLEAPKKPTNLSVNSDLLKKSKAMNINLSATLEQALTDKLAKLNSEKWAEENKNAIQAYNEFVEEHGCFGDEFREF